MAVLSSLTERGPAANTFSSGSSFGACQLITFQMQLFVVSCVQTAILISTVRSSTDVLEFDAKHR